MFPCKPVGIQVDTTSLSGFFPSPGAEEFMRRSLEFRCHESLLGRCANFKERLAYAENTVSSPSLDLLSDLREYLVDASKSGYVFPESSWNKFINDHHLIKGKKLKSPAYKNVIAKEYNTIRII
ncbi:hypothetical protein BJ546DRAFT_451243 [Cryomyces antarcticus]